MSADHPGRRPHSARDAARGTAHGTTQPEERQQIPPAELSTTAAHTAPESPSVTAAAQDESSRERPHFTLSLLVSGRRMFARGSGRPLALTAGGRFHLARELTGFATAPPYVCSVCARIPPPRPHAPTWAQSSVRVNHPRSGRRSPPPIPRPPAALVFLGSCPAAGTGSIRSIMSSPGGPARHQDLQAEPFVSPPPAGRPARMTV